MPVLNTRLPVLACGARKGKNRGSWEKFTGMARRRRREAKVIRKVIPKVFPCPKCGMQAVSVIGNKASESVRVICGNCGLSTDLNYVGNMENVDYFNRFVDKYHGGEIS